MIEEMIGGDWKLMEQTLIKEMGELDLGQSEEK